MSGRDAPFLGRGGLIRIRQLGHGEDKPMVLAEGGELSKLPGAALKSTSKRRASRWGVGSAEEPKLCCSGAASTAIDLDY
jgi:hypothetical protein